MTTPVTSEVSNSGFGGFPSDCQVENVFKPLNAVPRLKLSELPAERGVPLEEDLPPLHSRRGAISGDKV